MSVGAARSVARTQDSFCIEIADLLLLSIDPTFEIPAIGRPDFTNGAPSFGSQKII